MNDELLEMYDAAENLLERGMVAAAILQAAGIELLVGELQPVDFYEPESWE